MRLVSSKARGATFYQAVQQHQTNCTIARRPVTPVSPPTPFTASWRVVTLVSGGCTSRPPFATTASPTNKHTTTAPRSTPTRGIYTSVVLAVVCLSFCVVTSWLVVASPLPHGESCRSAAPAALRVARFGALQHEIPTQHAQNAAPRKYIHVCVDCGAGVRVPPWFLRRPAPWQQQLGTLALPGWRATTAATAPAGISRARGSYHSRWHQIHTPTAY